MIFIYIIYIYLLNKFISFLNSFKIIEDPENRGFKFMRNIYGDEINHLNCRSLWIDKYNIVYRCSKLK